MTEARNLASIVIGGVTFAQGDGVLLSATCTRTRKKGGGSLSVSLADPRGELANLLPLPASNQPVQVIALWGPARRQRRVFAGRLVTFSWDYAGKRLELQAVDRTRGAKLVERARVCSTVDLQDLAQQVAEQLGARLDAPPALIQALGAYGSVVQHGESDWELLARLCSSVGCDVWLEEPTEEAAIPTAQPTLYVRQAGELASVSAPFILRAGDNLAGFQVQVEAKTRRTTSNIVNLKGVPVLAGADQEAQARAVQLANTGVVLGASEDAPSFGEADIQRALLAGARQRKVFEATATVAPGAPGLTPARAVFVEGLGARYNGAWVVETLKDDLLQDRSVLSLYNDGAP